MSGANDENQGLELSRIIFIGRTFEEYKVMFGLTEEEIRAYEILDCPSGACSFTAIANGLGGRVTAADIAYYHAVEELNDKGLQDIEHAIESIAKVKNKYVWDYFSNVNELKDARISALMNSVQDMKNSPQSYNAVTLPLLPFANNQFDLTLSAHFLFTYADRLDFEFHKQTIQELLRVTRKEIRIFPLVDLTGNRYEHLDTIIHYLQEEGCTVTEVKVDYEFQRYANRMLRVSKCEQDY
ncbi:class I SAM-dependent methyltransferase [Paenibacillus sp. N1-5-1-14]|uniref:class I SAM-dependent methyltransferase n=1 Tax=Paenibacillus radicibacter TaxID=2972488 RepID=UPI002158FBB7|nr:class I SAM-dependent methyltransferase [Paenibacillus radicibacter]MCR8644441.1 class I SAM-dependent methyltransferase [Paenibacillus radicibacter]